MDIITLSSLLKPDTETNISSNNYMYKGIYLTNRGYKSYKSIILNRHAVAQYGNFRGHLGYAYSGVFRIIYNIIIIYIFWH